MSTESYTAWSSSFNESTMGLPLFDPLTSVDAPHPDLFDEDIGELEFGWSFQLSILLRVGVGVGDTFPDLAPVFPSPSVFTNFTESSSDTAPSEYSYTGPPSERSVTLSSNFQSVGVNSAYGGVDTTDGHIHPSPFPNNLTWSLPSPSASIQAAPDAQPRSGPTRKHQCPKCGHAFKRLFNLKTHMELHDPKIRKRFVCPHSTCKRPFRRKHDLKRHCRSRHSDQASISSDYDPSWVSEPAVAVTVGTRG